MKKTFPNLETVPTSDSPATLVFWHVVTWRAYPPRLAVISFHSWPRAFHGNDDFGDPNPAEYEMLREMAYAKKKQKASWILWWIFHRFTNWEDSLWWWWWWWWWWWDPRTLIIQRSTKNADSFASLIVVFFDFFLGLSVTDSWFIMHPDLTTRTI